MVGLDHSWPFIAHLLNKVVHMSAVVCLLSKNVCTRSDSLQEYVSLFALAHFNAFLDYIVAVPVFHHHLENSVHRLAILIL